MFKTAVVVAGLVGTLCLAPVAQADDQDDYVFFHALKENGLTVTNPKGMLQQGHQVCSELAAGQPWRIVATRLMTGPGYTQPEASAILASSIAAYCPDSASGPINDMLKS